MDVQAETYTDLGQWMPPVCFVLVILSAVVGRLWEEEVLPENDCELVSSSTPS